MSAASPTALSALRSPKSMWSASAVLNLLATRVAALPCLYCLFCRSLHLPDSLTQRDGAAQVSPFTTPRFTSSDKQRPSHFASHMLLRRGAELDALEGGRRLFESQLIENAVIEFGPSSRWAARNRPIPTLTLPSAEPPHVHPSPKRPLPHAEPFPAAGRASATTPHAASKSSTAFSTSGTKYVTFPARNHEEPRKPWTTSVPLLPRLLLLTPTR